MHRTHRTVYKSCTGHTDRTGLNIQHAPGVWIIVADFHLCSLLGILSHCTIPTVLFTNISNWLQNRQDGSTILPLRNCQESPCALNFLVSFFSAHKRPSTFFYTNPTEKPF